MKYVTQLLINLGMLTQHARMYLGTYIETRGGSLAYVDGRGNHKRIAVLTREEHESLRSGS